MKKSIVLVFLIVTLNSFSQWDTAFFQHEHCRINDVWVFDNDNFLVASDYQWSGQIYSTTDGGESYYVFTFDDWIQAFFFVNDTIGYAGGNDNYGIYKTYDKGRTWRLIDSETFFLDVYYMYFFSEKTGIVNQRWTYDGGHSWQTEEFHVHSVLKITDSVSFACYHSAEYGIAKTEDNGLSWEIVHDSMYASDLIEVGPNHHIVLSGEVLYHSYDLFHSFDDTTYIHDFTGNRMFIGFADSLNGIMVTYSSSYSTPRMKVFATQDGGYSWYHTDLIDGWHNYWGGKNPVHCLADQTFISTFHTLLRSPEGSIGPTKAINPVKPRTLGGKVIPAAKARNIEIQSDSAGNIYLACTFEGQIEIGDTAINHSCKGSLLYAKLDNDLNIIWLHTFGSNDHFSIPFNLHVFNDGSSVIHLKLTGEYYIDSEGPFSGGFILFHHDQNGEILDQLTIEGYLSDQTMEGDNTSKIFLGGLVNGTISVEEDTLIGPSVFLLLWNIENDNYELKVVAKYYEVYAPATNIIMAYDVEHDILYYSADYRDSILINDQIYTTLHQSSGYYPYYWHAYYMLEISSDGSIASIEPNLCEVRVSWNEVFRDYMFFPNGRTAILGVQKDSIYYNSTYYPPEQGERSFIIQTQDIGNAPGLNYLGEKPWGIQAYQAITYQDNLIINAHQEFKTPFGKDMIYNAGNMYKDDNVFLFYDSDLKYTGYYQLVDQHYNTDIEVTGDRVFLGGSSNDHAIEFENETYYNNGESYYYLAELDFQYLNVEESVKAIIEPLKMFPNPSTGRFMIEIPDNCRQGTLSIYSLHGRFLRSEYFSNESEKELLLDEPPGIYLLKLTSGKRSYAGKIIISEN